MGCAGSVPQQPAQQQTGAASGAAAAGSAAAAKSSNPVPVPNKNVQSHQASGQPEVRSAKLTVDEAPPSQHNGHAKNSASPQLTIPTTPPMLQPMGEKGSTRALEIPFDELTVGDVVASGGYKDVHKGMWKDQPVAIGVMKSKDLPDEEMTEFMHETSMLASLSHPNIVRLYGIVTAMDSPLCVVMQLVGRYNLYNIVHEKKGEPLNPRASWKICIGMAGGLRYLHREGVAHRDMKSLNVLVEGDSEVKLADFGMSKRKAGGALDQTTMASTVCGTPLWMPPELMKGQKYNPFLADVYSLALCVFEALYQGLPYPNVRTNNDLIRRVAIRGERPKFVANDVVPEAIIPLLQGCVKDPDDRPRLMEILKGLRYHCPFEDLKQSRTPTSAAGGPGAEGNWAGPLLTPKNLAISAADFALATEVENRDPFSLGPPELDKPSADAKPSERRPSVEKISTGRISGSATPPAEKAATGDHLRLSPSENQKFKDELKRRLSGSGPSGGDGSSGGGPMDSKDLILNKVQQQQNSRDADLGAHASQGKI